MQRACMGCLMELAEQDPDILYLTADSGEGGLDLMFRRDFPDRSFNFGIAEENMVASAAGMALAGKIPFVYAAAPFLAYRAYEFIRNDVCLQNISVKLIGAGSGLSVSSLGATHHGTEDISALRCLPNLRILSPATPNQARACMMDAYRHPGPVYIRLGMHGEEEFFTSDQALQACGYDVICHGTDVGILTTGGILCEAVSTAEILQRNGISASVISVPVLKPFGTEVFDRELNGIRTICTVEEHSVAGGLGGIAAEAIASEGMNRRLIRIGLCDHFARGYGTLRQLRKENKLDAESIAAAVREAIT